MTSLKYLLDEGRIESVEPDTAVAKDKLEEAKRHLASAAAIAEDDPEGAYSLVYDAARKAADAHMLANGYRASKSKVGNHEATARMQRESSRLLRPLSRISFPEKGSGFSDTARKRVRQPHRSLHRANRRGQAPLPPVSRPSF